MGKEWLDGYRVCRRRGKSYVSTYMGVSTIDGWKIYAIGRVTRRTPGYGPLAVFELADDARGFMKQNNMYADGYALFGCRYTESEDTDLWRLGPTFERCVCVCRITGTHYADEVEPVREMAV